MRTFPLIVLASALVASAPPAAAQPTRSSAIATAADGVVFVVNPDSGTVARLQYDAANAGQLSPAEPQAVGTYPRTLALAGEFVFTADQTSDTVSRRRQQDLGDLRQVSLGVGCAPYGVAPVPGGGIAVSCQGTSELVLLDLDLGVQARVKLPWSQARGIAVSADGARAYVTHYLTEEPNHDAHVSVVDVAGAAVSSVLAIPPDLSTCETQNSGQGPLNLVSAIALVPDGAPAEVRNQLWVGGTVENAISKGLFKRNAQFGEVNGAELFPWVQFTPFPTGGGSRNVYKSSFHDITRFGIFKVDLGTGQVVGKIDVDEANNATDIEFSPDGKVAYVVDLMFNSFHILNTARGQGSNATTVFAAVSRSGPGGASCPFGSASCEDSCTPEPLRSVASESPFRIAPQAQISVLDGIDPVRPDGAGGFVPVATGVEFDAGWYLATGRSRMMTAPDGIGTAPIGVRLDPNGQRVFVANYLARNVVVAASATAEARSPDLRCSNAPATTCGVSDDCRGAGGGGFCNHPGGGACTTDADCGTNGPCVQTAQCVPLLLGEPVATIANGAGTCSTPAATPCTGAAACTEDPGFCNTTGAACATDGECGDALPAPGICNETEAPCTTSADCTQTGDRCVPVVAPTCVHRAVCVAVPGDPLDPSLLDGKILFNTAARDSSVVNSIGLDQAAPLFNNPHRATIAAVPGAVTNVAHDASYVTCSTCHADFGGQDGRTWDFAQFGASLRNTMDLRGRAGFAPGTCSDDPARECFFDAGCGPDATCRMNPALVPPNIAPADRARYFNPMLTVHWNGDRDEVEDFEHTYRSLLGAGDCDGIEFARSCFGGLVQRSRFTSIDPVDVNGDLGAPNRNLRGAAHGTHGGVRLTHMADFVYSLTQFPKNPNPVTEAVERGRRIFNDPQTQCASCHNGGPGAGRQFFTDKKPNPGFDPASPGRADRNNPFVRHDVGTANLFDAVDPYAVAQQNNNFQNPGNQPDTRTIPGSRGVLGDYVTPVLNDLWNTPPYLHDGSAHTLLDVVRPCDTTTGDACFVAGRGRNLNGQHGVTAMLTPQQLNDLVAFQNALTTASVVGTNERVIVAGALDLTRVSLVLPRARQGRKRARKGKLVVTGVLRGAPAPIDPATGVALQLATPDGGRMAILSASPAMHRRGRRFVGATAAGAAIKLTLRPSGSDYRFQLLARGAELAALDTDNTDLTVAFEIGGVQFVRNRPLVERKGALGLPKRPGKGRRGP